jgi:maleylpyruvate isomerase
MTGFADDPMIRHLCDQTDLLLASVARLDAQTAQAPSLLPGWTRGHVLTHLARNADGLANVARSAITGDVVPMYRSVAQRDADIEAGAHRRVAELEADVESSSERLLALLADVPSDALDVGVPSGRGTDVRVGDVPWLRTREVVYHHVDLGVGFTFVDVPEPLLRRGLEECPGRLSDARPGAAVRCTYRDGSSQDLAVGDAATKVEGPAPEVLAWLTGRSDGAGLTCADGALPTLPSWG